MHCPACAAFRNDKESGFAFCNQCGHRWLVHASATHAAIEVTTYTEHYVGYIDDPKFVNSIAEFIRKEFAHRVPPPARLLDVGCGAGEFLSVAREAGYEAQGIDVSEASARLCKGRGLSAQTGDFLKQEFSHKFDLITMWDVVEHLFDPAAFLSRARELLSDQGYFFAKVPGFGDFSVRVASTSIKAANILLGAPAHVQFFDQESLSVLLAREGYSFEFLEWGSIRTPAAGGNLKRKVARKIAGTVAGISGDRQLFVIAQANA